MSAFIALGANLGRPVEQLQRALLLVGQLPQTQIVRASGFYASAAVGYTDQPDFVNAVAEVETALTASQLLEALLAIEAVLGRVRTFQNAPRTIDLDVILYGDARIETPALIVPHPRMHERAFVLRPLLEIAPDIFIPGLGAASAFLPQVADQALSRLPDR
jgi:2-amino-4-hydroxy-6-hydroxymethyldihydropteridine diphosphokinase